MEVKTTAVPSLFIPGDAGKSDFPHTL